VVLLAGGPAHVGEPAPQRDGSSLTGFAVRGPSPALSGYAWGMTEITNPPPDDPGGASAMDEESTLVNGSQQLLDGASTGTDAGPGGVPAALAGVDEDGDEVPPPPAARPGDAGRSTGPAEEDELLSGSDTSSPLQTSSGRGGSAAPGGIPAERGGR
jgi:hypothetical protein